MVPEVAAKHMPGTWHFLPENSRDEIVLKVKTYATTGHSVHAQVVLANVRSVPVWQAAAG